MTDREALEQLLDRFGLNPVPSDGGDSDFGKPDPNDVVLIAKYGGVGGYSGFFIAFEFDDDGSFKQAGIFE